MSDEQLIEEYKKTLCALEKRHAQLKKQITVYDRRITLLEEEIDEVWEVIAALRKHGEGDKYGWRGNGVSAALGRAGISGVLGL